MVGESLVGEGNEVAHIDLIVGPRGSAAETAFATALTNNKDGFTSLLAVIAPNLLAKPSTVMFNKVTIKGAKQAVQMFGPAQHAVAKAVADSVADGTIPADEADDLFICVGVFIHWLAEDDKKIQDFNYRAVKEVDRARGRRQADAGRGGRPAQHRQASVQRLTGSKPSPPDARALLARFFLRCKRGQARRESLTLRSFDSSLPAQSEVFGISPALPPLAPRSFARPPPGSGVPKRASTARPPSGSETTSVSPPSIRTRSRMPESPIPPLP